MPVTTFRGVRTTGPNEQFDVIIVQWEDRIDALQGWATPENASRDGGNDDAIFDPRTTAHDARVRPLVGSRRPGCRPSRQPGPRRRSTVGLGGVAEGARADAGSHGLRAAATGPQVAPGR